MKKNTSLILLSLLLVIAGKSQTAASIYQHFKDNQFKFPKQPFYDTIVIGSFNVPTNQFTGIRSFEVQVGRVWKRKYPYTPSRAKRSVVKFSVTNFNEPFFVTVNGITHNSSPGSQYLFIDVYNEKEVKWKLTAGSKEVSDMVKITKLPFIAAGVFRIPYLVAAIVYQPPKDAAGNSFTSYAQTEFMGSAVSLGFGKVQTETKPVNTDFAQFKQLLSTGAGALANADDPYLKAAGTVLGALNQGIGSYNATETKGRSVNGELTFSVADISSLEISTSVPNTGGPGIGDRFFCLKDCKFLWYVENEKFYTTLLSTNGHISPSADDLKDILNNGNERDKFLLGPIAALDPFFKNGTNTTFPKKRFGEPKYYGQVGGPVTYTEKHSVTHADKTVNASYSTLTEDYVTGWLTYLGLPGVDETKTISTTISTSFSKAITNGSEITAIIKLDRSTPVKDYWVFYDRLFGTFAVTDKLPAEVHPTHTGIYSDIYGNPQPGKIIKIVHQGKTYEAITNEKGEYRFYQPELKDYTPVVKPVLKKQVN